MPERIDSRGWLISKLIPRQPFQSQWLHFLGLLMNKQGCGPFFGFAAPHVPHIFELLVDPCMPKI